MMTPLNLARIAKLIALFGFVLPWVLVSCAGEPVGRVSGLDLATGGLGSHHADPNWWVAVSLAAVIAGLVLSFVLAARAAFVAVGAAALLALAASVVGVASATAPRTPPAPSPASSSAARVELQYGYFVTIAGLLTAIGACGAGLGRSRASA